MSYPRLEIVRGGRANGVPHSPADDVDSGAATDVYERPGRVERWAWRVIGGAVALLFVLLIVGYTFYLLDDGSRLP